MISALVSISIHLSLRFSKVIRTVILEIHPLSLKSFYWLLVSITEFLKFKNKTLFDVFPVKSEFMSSLKHK